MKTRELFKKYSYLMRIVLSVFLVFCITSLLLGFTVFVQAFNEMNRQNDEHYNKTCSMFTTMFNQQIEDLKEHAYTFSYNNNYEMKKITTEQFSENTYYFSEAIGILSRAKIGLSTVSDIGFSFIGSDVIVTSMYKYTVNEYAELVLNGNSNEKYIEFLTKYEGTKIRMLSTFGKVPLSDARLYIAVPVTMNSVHSAVIFYVLKYDALEFPAIKAQTAGDVGLYIINQDMSLFYANDQLPESFKEETFFDFVKDPNCLTISENGYSVYKNYNARYGKYFLLVVPQAAISSSINNFYKTLKNSFALILASLLLMLAVTVYISYKPIWRLVKNLKSGNESGGEINSIMRAFGEIEGTVTEQREILLDYVLLNLINNIPIPSADAKRFPDIFQNNAFMVLTVVGLRLDSSKREALCDAVLKETNSKVYVADIIYKNQVVFICIPNSAEDSSVVGAVKRFIQSTFGAVYKVGVGNRVISPDEIGISYSNSLTSLETVSIEKTEMGIDMSSIEDFTAENIALFLEYIKNGEKNNALKILDVLIKYIDSNIKTVLLRRYVCYNILSEYSKMLKQIGFCMDNRETTNLLEHTSSGELYESLSRSVINVCNHVKNKNLSVYDTLKRNIFDYIDENYTDINLCRTQVADHFGVSVYSFSRIFNDSSSVGFKEYINIKRLSMAKTLLLTTSDNIAQIAAAVGFSNADYFAKLFKASFDMTPTKFREQ